jgi:hypothetical protein
MGSDSYSQEIADRVAALLASGVSMNKIGQMEDMPSRECLMQWAGKYPQFALAISRAREEGTHTLAEQCLEIADNSDLDPADRRVKIDTRLRLIGKWNARAYGDKLDVTATVAVSADEAAGRLSQVLGVALPPLPGAREGDDR